MKFVACGSTEFVIFPFEFLTVRVRNGAEWQTTEREILLQREYDCLHQHRPERLEYNVLTESLFFACFFVLSKGLVYNPTSGEEMRDSERHLRSMIQLAYKDTYHEDPMKRCDWRSVSNDQRRFCQQQSRVCVPHDVGSDHVEFSLRLRHEEGDLPGREQGTESPLASSELPDLSGRLFRVPSFHAERRSDHSLAIGEETAHHHSSRRHHEGNRREHRRPVGKPQGRCSWLFSRRRPYSS